MDERTLARFEARAKVVKAMAHATRLFIMEELAKQERCVNDLTEMVGMDMSTVSRHLSILKNASLVKSEKRGTQVYYSLRMPCVMNFFECVEDVMKSTAAVHLDLVD